MRQHLAVAVASLFVSMSAHAADLLVNGGAETGDLSGWIVGGVSNPNVDNGSFNPGIDPFEGKYAFSGHTGLWGTLTQNVALAGVGSARGLAVSFWERGLNQGEPSDNAFVSLTYRGSNGEVISTLSTPVVDSHWSAWQHYQDVFAVPTLAASVDYTMHFQRVAGTDLDSYIDANSLTFVSPVPEAPAYAMFGAGIALMGLLRRRRAR